MTKRPNQDSTIKCNPLIGIESDQVLLDAEH
jgi:hypothetical protein